MKSSALMSVKDIKSDQTFNCDPAEAYTIYKTHIVNNIMNEIQTIDITEIAD
jgi:hypothetical protein